MMLAWQHLSSTPLSSFFCFVYLAKKDPMSGLYTMIEGSPFGLSASLLLLLAIHVRKRMVHIKHHPLKNRFTLYKTEATMLLI